MKTTGDQQLVKRINRSVLLRLIRAQPGLSRAQAAIASGLTKSTVSSAVRELIDEGWLSESVAPAASGLGRPSTPLWINSKGHGSIGVEVGVDCLRVVGVSLLGEVFWSMEQPLRRTQPAAVCKQVANLVSLAHAELSARGVATSGIGIGLPGAFDETAGIVRFAPNLGWRNVDFMSQFTRAMAAKGLPQIPVHIQNEADAAALGEYEFAQNENQDALIFINCDVGVGAGIVLNDRLFTGAQGMAGEIGHSIMQIDGPLCSCGRRGCAETFIGARALAREIKQHGNLQLAGRYLGVLIQNLWTTFNPGVLVMGGASCIRHPELVQMAQDTLQTYAQSAGVAAPMVRRARYDLLAAAVGAAALVVHQFLRPLHPPAQGVPDILPASGALGKPVAIPLVALNPPIPLVNLEQHVSWH
jgi:predicted NBD/HSP70 family sugar kinase